MYYRELKLGQHYPQFALAYYTNQNIETYASGTNLTLAQWGEVLSSMKINCVGNIFCVLKQVIDGGSHQVTGYQGCNIDMKNLSLPLSFTTLFESGSSNYDVYSDTVTEL